MWRVGVNFHVHSGADLSETTVIYSTGGKKKKKKGDKETDSRSETPAEEPQASGAGSPAPDAQAPDSEEAPAGDFEEVAMPKTVSIRVYGPRNDNCNFHKHVFPIPYFVTSVELFSETINLCELVDLSF